MRFLLIFAALVAGCGNRGSSPSANDASTSSDDQTYARCECCDGVVHYVLASIGCGSGECDGPPGNCNRVPGGGSEPDADVDAQADAAPE